MKCHTCKKEFDAVINSIRGVMGQNANWVLYRCPNCKQEYAQGHNIPEEMEKDTQIIKIQAKTGSITFTQKE